LICLSLEQDLVYEQYTVDLSEDKVGRKLGHSRIGTELAVHWNFPTPAPSLGLIHISRIPLSFVLLHQ